MATVSTEVVTGTALWSDLGPRLKSGGPRYAAIAFAGSDAPELLPLGKGDVLVVNAGNQTLGAGGTNPKALRKFTDRGVEVWSHSRLHAKVIATSEVAVVGSANASANSGTLHEAVTLTTDPAARATVIDFVRALTRQAQRVDSTFLKEAAKHYRDPIGRPGAGAAPPDLFTELPGRLWLISDGDGDSDAVAAAAESEISRLGAVAGAEYSFHEVPVNDECEPGDVLVWFENGWLLPPGIAQQLPAGGAVGGKRRPFIVELFDPRMKSRRLSALPVPLAKAFRNPRNPSGPNYALITDREKVAEIMELWVPGLE